MIRESNNADSPSTFLAYYRTHTTAATMSHHCTTFYYTVYVNRTSMVQLALKKGGGRNGFATCMYGIWHSVYYVQ